jgi:hypothetical protein
VDPAYLAFLAGLGLGPRPEHVIVAEGNGRAEGRPLVERLLGEPATLARAARVLGGESVTIEPYAATTDLMALAGVMERECGIRVRVDGGAGVARYVGVKHRMRAVAREVGMRGAVGVVAVVA